MSYSILTEARVKPSVSDLQPSERSYSIFWVENGNLEGWDSILDLDIVGTWDGFLFGTKETADTGSIGPSSNFPSVDAQANERIFFRMKYDKHPRNNSSTDRGKIRFTTVADPIFDDEKSVTFEVISDGKWHLYEINMGQVSTWVGLINNIRFFPCINGARNDEFFLNFFEIGSNEFTFSFSNTKAGSAGKATGALALTEPIAIVKDSNDKLIVNIDGYGDVQITLTPQIAQPLLIARDISLQLGKVGIGGYIRAEAFIEPLTNKLSIESGIRAADSSVEIKSGSQSAGGVLGFLDALGTFIGTTTAGVDPADDFEPLAAYSPTTLELLALFDNDLDLPSFTLDPKTYVVEGGRRDYGTTNRRLNTQTIVEGRDTNFQGQKIQTVDAFDGQSKTFIDLNHPFTDDGPLDKVFMNGIADTGGASKWKVFRPNLNGTLSMVAEGSIGATPSLTGNQVLTIEPGVYVADVSNQNINVRRGDLLGIYNADLHVGGFGPSKVDALYYEISGDATGTITPSSPSGAGEAGLPVYAHGRVTKNKAVVDIDLQKRLNLDVLEVRGFEDARDLEYNIATANSSSFSIDLSGAHTVCYDPTPITRTCFSRTNRAYNVAALNDNIVFAENGITGFGNGGPGGTGGANAAGATYFYLNGDGEFLGVEEFVNQNAERYDFTRDPYGIDCFFTSSTPRLDKPIGKAVVYFKEKKNQRSWQIEVLPGLGAGGGLDLGSKEGFRLIPQDSLNAVEIDTKRFEQLKGFVTTKSDSDAADLLLRNPVILDTIAADGTRNPQKGVDFDFSVAELGGVNFREQATFLSFQWNKYQWEFDSIRASAFRYYSDFHWSTKISEFQIFAVSQSQESLGDNTQVLFSFDGETFSTANLISSTETTASYKLGGSPQYLRLIFRPTTQLSLNEVQAQFEEDQVCFGEEGRILGAVDIPDSRVGQVGEALPVKVLNDTSETADLILDIPPDIQSSRQLLYFSRLHSSSDITTPQVGPPGRVDFTSDKVLKEQENIAINAQCYGLKSLISGTENVLITDNLLSNPGFETGNLSGWDLTITQSGTSSFQVPRVFDIDNVPDEDTAADIFQAGDYVFGFSIDKDILEHEEDFVPVEFELFSEAIDVSEYADSIDTGQAFAILSFRYITFFTGSAPTVRFLGAPSLAGVDSPVGTVISASFGTNVLRSDNIAKSSSISDQSATGSNLTATLQARIKPSTRYLKIQVYVNATSETASGGYAREKFIADDFDLTLQIPSVTTTKWYKSWRTGAVPSTPGAEFDGWTDSSFSPVTEFVAVTGSSHWYQPFDSSNLVGTPGGGSLTQNLGYSNVFLADRFKGAQSFSRMTIASPGIIGAQWSGEKDIAGFRIAMHHTTSTSTFFADAWPRHFQAEVLKTASELGGVTPDINNPSHFKLATLYRNVDAEVAPSSELNGSASASRGPWSIITTWLFDEKPIRTTGLRIMFTWNCDKFERDVYANSALFANNTGCPPDNVTGPTSDWTSVRGIGVGYFVPLESVGNTNLPVDNVQETHIGAADNALGNVYAAVDLGRRHAIETDSDLFELIATTPSQSEFNLGSVAYSADETDDPNQVVWAGSSSNARWIRFRTNASIKYEDPGLLEGTSYTSSSATFVENIPQAILTQARIYPDITNTLIPTVGYNSEWEDLGTSLADSLTTTSIYYSDYPVIALDLTKRYVIDNDSLPRKRHDLVSSEPQGGAGSTDLQHWVSNSEDNWSYSAVGVSEPERVPFAAYGAGLPDNEVRWVAVKGAAPLLVSDAGDPPKRYNFRTPGQTLFYVTVRPRSEQVFTENASWFSNTTAGLRDISTFDFTLGQPNDVLDGQDYGSAAGSSNISSSGTANNIGSPYFAFDGKFDELGALSDIWGVAVRDIVTGLENSDDDFPHSIWRVFRNTQTDTEETKSVKAITILGYNENFYPKSFTIQKLKENSDGSIKDPNSNTSWQNISGASFSNVDTFQNGFGFTYVFPTAVSTKGIRVRITSSEYVDDSVVTQTEPTTGQTNATFAQVSGPQTRVAQITLYEETTETSVIQGTIETNHMLSAAVSSNTSTPGHPVNHLSDNNIKTYWQSTGFVDTVTITLPAARSITRMEWEKDVNLGAQSSAGSTGAPYNFTLKGTVGGSNQTLVVGSGVEGTTFSGTLTGGPITAQNFTFEVTSVQGEQEDANSIILSELRLIEVENRTSPLITIDSVSARRPGGANLSSTKVTYASNADSVAKVTADGIDGGSDSYWSQRDFFSLWVHINDVSLLDTTFGNFKLGNDDETFYQWNFGGLNLQSGWNELKLQFKSANDKSEVEFQPGFQYDSNTGESQVDFRTAKTSISSNIDGIYSRRTTRTPGVRFFEMEFRGTKGSSPLEIILDDFRFVRNRFDDKCKFAPSLYLNNSELFTIFLEGLDISSGAVEFWFQPDWDTGARLAADRPIIPALFRIVRPDGKFLSLFYRPNQGFIPMIYDGEQLLQFVTSVDTYRFDRFETFHVALVWDAERRILPQRASLALHINGDPVFGTDITWNAIREGGASVSFGGEVGQRFAATPNNSTSLLFTAVPTQAARNTASTWGLIENLKIYNYPKRDFSDIDSPNLERTQLITPAEMIEISIDNSTFVGVGSAQLPLTVQDVPPGGSAVVYIRTNLPRKLTGDEKRDASLLVRWKTPLRDCD